MKTKDKKKQEKPEQKKNDTLHEFVMELNRQLRAPGNESLSDHLGV